jgi:nucleotide-binding universal stress UspA family protein
LKILVYVDGSDASFRAVDRAIEMAKAGEQITAIHVSPPRLDRDTVSQFDYEPEDWDSMFADEVSDKVKVRLGEAGVNAEVVEREGPVAEMITSFADEGDYDLILIGGRDTTAGRMFDLSEIVRQASSKKVEVVY